MADVKISDLAADTSVGGSEKLVGVDGTTTKTVTVDQISAYTIDELMGSSAVTPGAAGDDIVIFRDDAAKLLGIADLAAYVAPIAVASGWTAAGEADPAVSGDMILANRSGTVYELDVDTVATYALASGASATPVTSMAAADSLLLYRGGVPKLVDIAYVAPYVLATAWSADTVTTLLSTDNVLVGRSAASKRVTLANLEAQIVEDTAASIRNISGLTAATLGVTDEFLVNQSGVALKASLSTIEAKLWTDFATYAGALNDAASVVDADKFYILHSGTPKHCTAVEVADYVTAELWDAATASAAVSGDTLLINHSGTMGELTVDLLATYVNASAQATVTNISGLASATLAGTDYLLVCQGTAGRQATVAAMASFVHDAFSTYQAALNSVASLSDSDTLYCVQGGTARKVSVGTVVAYAATAAMTLPWRTIAGSKYTSTPTSTSTIAMTDTSDLKIGVPVKYTYLGTTYYGIVTSIASNASITIAGAPLSITNALSALCVGIPEMVEQVDFTITTPYDNAAQDLLAAVEERYFKWQKAKAYLVSFSATNHWPDSGAIQPYVNVKIAGNLVSTDASTHGVQVSAVAGTWTDNSAVGISSANYEIERGDALDIRCTVAGTTGDAECLTVSCVFVYE